MTMKQNFAAAALAFTAVSTGLAQPPEAGERVFNVQVAPPPPGSANRMYKAQTFSYISSEFSFDGAVVKNAPYSAEAVSETTQRLADGNRISQKSTTQMYRDSEGRTRREETLGAIGPWASGSEPVRTVFINDPVSKTNWVLDSRAKVARKMPMPEVHTLPAPANGQQAGAAGAITVQGDFVKRVGVTTGNVAFGVAGVPGPPLAGITMAMPAIPMGENAKTESLGTQVIEGIRADGTRSTMTIPANAMGNDLPIEIVSERWYSPDLQTVVTSKRSDPRMGETVYRLTNVSRNEPSRSLFDVPADYTVSDDSADFKRAMEKATKEKLKE
jgi:hypothetical protein